MWFDRERISTIDPLGADEVCRRLPEMNAAADVGAMADTVCAMLPSDTEIASWSLHERLAAMRDLGLFLGSIRRHGCEPVELVPGFEHVLLELGRRTDMIPLYLADLALWASDRGDAAFDGFLREALALTVPQWRALVPAWCGRASLVSVVVSALEAAEPDGVPDPLRRSAEALGGALRSLLVFRGRHLGIARKAYHEEMPLLPTGTTRATLDLPPALPLLPP